MKEDEIKMSLTWIIVLIIILIIILLILIFILLGFIQQQKIRLFKITKQDLKNKIDTIQKLLLQKKLKPITIQYELPVGEECYFLGQSKIYSNNAKHDFDINILNFEKDLNKTYQFDIVSLNGYLNLKPKWEVNTYQGMLYVTNKRVLLEGTTAIKTIWVEDIIYTNPTVLNFSEGYFIGVIIITNENKIYKVVNDDINLAATLYWLIQKNRRGE